MRRQQEEDKEEEMKRSKGCVRGDREEGRKEKSH